MHDEWREVQVRPSASALMGDGGSPLGGEGEGGDAVCVNH